MHSIRPIIRKNFKLTLIVMILCGIGYAVTAWQTIFAGLLLGMLFGLYNMWTLVRRMDRFERAIERGKRWAPLGTALRFISAIAAVALASAFPKQFDLISTVIGLAIPYVLLLLERITSHAKSQS